MQDSPIGGIYKIPHGVVCGTLLSEATKINIEMLQKQGIDGKKGLKKYAKIGALLKGKYHLEEGKINEFCLMLIETLEKWTDKLKINRLGKYGITNEDIEKIVEKTSLKNNPVNLSKDYIRNIVINRL